MKKQATYLMTALIILLLSSCRLNGANDQRDNDTVSEDSSVFELEGATPGPTPIAGDNDTVSERSTASWTSQARTVEEVTRESDVIVRVQVIEEPTTRVVDFSSPIVDEKGTPTDEMYTTTILFADTLMEVVTSYKGNPPSQLLVMQTGGTSPSGQTSQFSDDPLYKVGEEYILFLVDISGDKIHAPDRELYRTVNPAGRFQIDGNTATTFAEAYMNQGLPTTLSDLEQQIVAATKS